MIVTNPWGKSDDFEPQRSDLWFVDFSTVYDGLMRNQSIASQIDMDRNSGMSMLGYLASLKPMAGKRDFIRFYASSVSIPEVSINAEQTERDSRPYNSPGCDAPLGQIRMTFVHDISVDSKRSEIYALLHAWRILVRAGRGGMSNEFAITLDDDFKVNYGFDVSVNFMRGLDLNAMVKLLDNNAAAGGLEVSARYTIKNCWISSLGVGQDLTYESSKFATVNATFFGDDVFPENYRT